MPRDSVHVEQEELEGLVLGADLHDGVVPAHSAEGAQLGEDNSVAPRRRYLGDLGVVPAAVEQVRAFALPAAVILDQLPPQVPPDSQQCVVAHLGAVDRQLVPDPDVGHLGPALGRQVPSVVTDEVGESVSGIFGPDPVPGPARGDVFDYIDDGRELYGPRTWRSRSG